MPFLRVLYRTCRQLVVRSSFSVAMRRKHIALLLNLIVRYNIETKFFSNITPEL